MITTSTLGLNTLFVKVSLAISNWDNHADDLRTACCLTQYVRHCILLQIFLVYYVLLRIFISYSGILVFLTAFLFVIKKLPLNVSTFATLCRF